MNNDRRKVLSGLVNDLTKLKEEVEGVGEIEDEEELADKEEAWCSTVEDIHGQLEECKDEEQEYYDNMPESFQNGERGSNAQTAIDAMQEGMDALDELMNQSEVGELQKILVDKCETAIAQIEEAQA